MQRCAELNMPALAMTDHGNLFGAMDFYKKCTKAGIKPLIGCEIYLVHDHKQSERPKRDRKRSDDIDDIPENELKPEDFPRHQIHHKTLIAKDFEGYQNLVRLVSDAHVNGVYYRPRTDMEKLAQYSKGIIGLSGCVNGVASQYLIYNDYENARKATAEFIDIFGKENYFIEIQDHGLSFQKRIIPGLLKLSKEFDLKVVCANDVHYVYKDDSKPHDALLCIQTGRLVKDENRMKYPCNEFYLKSHSEMSQVFKEVPESLENTLRVAEMVDVKIKFGENHYPVFERPIEITYTPDNNTFDRILDRYVVEKNTVLTRDGKDPISLSTEDRDFFKKNGTYLLDLCKKGLIDRYNIDYDTAERRDDIDGKGPPPKPTDPEYEAYVCAKLEYELSIIIGAGFVDYFLITWDFINWARSQEIPVGPGRGSGAGSLIAYLIKITDIEPMRFGLLFERMLSLERVSPPDFDVDFCMRRRDLVVDYVRDKYGRDCVSNIITFGTFGAKMIMRDLARVLDVPYAEADRLAKMIPDELNIKLDDAVKKSDELQSELRTNTVAKEIIEQGKVIEGMVRNTGKHACGIIVCDEPLTNLIPVTMQEGALTTQYPKGPSEDLGLLKCDFLGLKTLTVISDAVDNVRRTTEHKRFDIEKVSLEDNNTYDLLNAGKTIGVFQLESGGMQNLCRRLGLSTFEEIIALIALYRPGPMQFIDQYIEGKKDPSTIQVPHPKVKELVSETYGVLVYQEQVMQVAQIVAGYTLGGADILRRAMGKKIASVMAAQKDVFIQGAKETSNVDRKEAESIFGLLEKFAQYGFNKSHSAAYAMLSYRTAFLKANYPVQFMAAVLGCELGNSDKVEHFIEECGAMGIKVKGPNINQSRDTFTPVFDGEISEGPQSIHYGNILFGMAAIKGVGSSAAESIIAEREANGAFKDFEDFAARIDMKAVNRRVVENLVKTGAFDELGEDRAALLEDMDAVLKNVSDLQKDKEVGQFNMFDMFSSPEEKNTTVTSVRRSKAQMPVATKLQLEKELMGFYVSGHPLNPFRAICEKVDTFVADSYTQLPDRTPYRLCGVVNSVTKKMSRKDNRLWGILSISTRKANYQINMYPEAYQSLMGPYMERMEDYKRQMAQEDIDESILYEPKDPLASGRLVLLEGSVSQRNGESMLTVDKVLPLKSTVQSLIEHVLFVIKPNDDSEDFICKCRQLLQRSFGQTEVEVGILMEEKYIAIAGIAGSLTWCVDESDFMELSAHPAVVDVILKLKPLAAPEPKWKRFNKKN